MTPKQGTPSSAKRKANQLPHRSSEKRRSSGRKRSNTYTLPEGTVSSPTVKEMMDSMKEGMSKDELKNSIQEVLNKNSKSSGKDKSWSLGNKTAVSSNLLHKQNLFLVIIGLGFIFYRMEFDKTRWFCPWNRAKTVPWLGWGF